MSWHWSKVGPTPESLVSLWKGTCGHRYAQRAVQPEDWSYANTSQVTSRSWRVAWNRAFPGAFRAGPASALTSDFSRTVQEQMPVALDTQCVWDFVMAALGNTILFWERPTQCRPTMDFTSHNGHISNRMEGQTFSGVGPGTIEWKRVVDLFLGGYNFKRKCDLGLKLSGEEGFVPEHKARGQGTWKAHKPQKGGNTRST